MQTTLDDCEALKKFLDDNSPYKVISECCKINKWGSNPLVTAGEFKSKDSLLILLRFISKIAAIGTRDETENCAEIMHCNGKSLLSVVMKSDFFIGTVQLEAIECEGYLHGWKSSDFQKCLQDNLGKTLQIL